MQFTRTMPANTKYRLKPSIIISLILFISFLILNEKNKNKKITQQYGQDRHKPSITGGPVIKYNANQRYATTSVTAFVLKELAKRNNVCRLLLLLFSSNFFFFFFCFLLVKLHVLQSITNIQSTLIDRKDSVARVCCSQ